MWDSDIWICTLIPAAVFSNVWVIFLILITGQPRTSWTERTKRRPGLFKLFFFLKCYFKILFVTGFTFFTLSPKGAQGPPGPPGKLVGVITLSAVHHCTIIVQWQGKKKKFETKIFQIRKIYSSTAPDLIKAGYMHTFLYFWPSERFLNVKWWVFPKDIWGNVKY